MRQGISHSVSRLQWKIRILASKFGGITPDVFRCFADDLQVTDDRILLFFVSQKGGTINIYEIAKSPVECAPGSPVELVCLARSYGLGLFQNFRFPSVRKRTWRQDVNINPK